MKKALIIIVLLMAVGVGYWLISPLFLDQEVNEEFPSSEQNQQETSDQTGSRQMEEGSENAADFVEIPSEEEINQMSDEARMAVERSIVEKMRDVETEPVQDSMDEMEGPELLAQGQFEDADNVHQGSGDAKIYELEDGGNVLRLENFEVTNGPDLFVYLVADENPQTDEEVENDFVNVGALKGNKGNQNYEIPTDVNLENYNSVVIWCRAFSVLFSTATLQDA